MSASNRNILVCSYEWGVKNVPLDMFRLYKCWNKYKYIQMDKTRSFIYEALKHY